MLDEQVTGVWFGWPEWMSDVEWVPEPQAERVAFVEVGHE